MTQSATAHSRQTPDGTVHGGRQDPWLLATLVWTGSALVYLTLVPVGNDVLLYPLLLSFGAIAVVNIIRHRLRPDRALVVPAVLWLAFLALGIVTAVVRDAASWPRTLVFFLLWPAVYSIVVAGFDRRVIRVVFVVGAWASVAIGVLLLVQASIEARYLPIGLPEWLSDTLRMEGSRSDGGVSLTATVMPPLLWWGGIWVASLFAAPEDAYLPPVWLRTLAASLIVVGAIASWRRAIVVVLVATPLLALIALLALTVRNTRWSEGPRITWKGLLRLGVVVILAVAAAALIQPRFLPMFNDVVASSGTVVHDAGSSDVDLNNEIRKGPSSLTVAESDSLADQIRQAESRAMLTPHSSADVLVGRGFGAAIDRSGLQRDTEPWKTELQYHAIFYWTGLIGVLLALAVALTAFLAVRKAYRVDPTLRGALFAGSVGALCLLMANASNPYLQAPGHMWPLFLPLMIACVSLRRSDGVSAR